MRVSQPGFVVFEVMMLFLSASLVAAPLVSAQSGLQLSPQTEMLSDLVQLPVSDDCIQRTYLVRHGESTANVYFEVDGKKVRYVSGQSTDVPLTDMGRHQIAGLAEKLAKLFPAQTKLVIVSSTAQRTRQTAKILFDRLSKTHPQVIFAKEAYQGLGERSLGGWEGLIKDEKYLAAEAPWKALSAAEKFVSPEVNGAESYSQVANRALLALAEIYSRYSDSTVIAVTSFNTINATAIQMNGMCGLLSNTGGTDLPKLHLGNGDLVLLEALRNQGFAGARVISHIKRGETD